MITLSQFEQRVCKGIAKARFDRARKNGIKNNKVGPQTNAETDLNGVGAELAFCKIFNVYPDLTVNHRPVEDALLKNGESVDVKTTKYKNGHLIAVQNKINVMCDKYALMVGEFPSYRFAGFISSDELFSDKNLKDFGYGPAYAAGQNQLSQ